MGIPSALITIWADCNGPDTFVQIIRHNDRLKVFTMMSLQGNSICCLLSRLNMLEFERESNGNKIFAGKSFDKEEKLDIIKVKKIISKL